MDGRQNDGLIDRRGWLRVKHIIFKIFVRIRNAANHWFSMFRWNSGRFCRLVVIARRHQRQPRAGNLDAAALNFFQTTGGIHRGTIGQKGHGIATGDEVTPANQPPGFAR